MESPKTVEQSLHKFGIVPSDKALPEIRSLLRREAELERAGRQRAEDLALLSAVQLFSRGHLKDVLLIWEAKQSGMDLGAYLDVKLLCGAGLEPTKSFLSNQPSEAARDALAWIEQMELEGHFEGFSPEVELEHYRTYFGVS